MREGGRESGAPNSEERMQEKRVLSRLSTESTSFDFCQKVTLLPGPRGSSPDRKKRPQPKTKERKTTKTFTHTTPLLSYLSPMPVSPKVHHRYHRKFGSYCFFCFLFTFLFVCLFVNGRKVCVPQPSDKSRQSDEWTTYYQVPASGSGEEKESGLGLGS